jgi:hypothetical protein
MKRRTVIVLASGASLTQAEADQCREATLGKNAYLIAVGNAAHLVPADIAYACDGRWWDHYGHAVRGAAYRYGMKGAADGRGVRLIEGREGWGLSSESGWVFWGGRLPIGGNSGAQAVQLAWHQYDPDRIALLGFDMHGTHFFGEHKADGLSNPLPQNFHHWIEGFEVLERQLAINGCQLVNCTKGSALNVLRVPLETVLDEL